MASSPLNIRPDGLLSFFGIKDGGWSPRTLGQELVPTSDLWRHFVAANSVDIDGSVQVAGAVASGGTQAAIVWNLPTTPQPPNPIPAGELWYVDSLTVFCFMSIGAGSRLNLLNFASINVPTTRIHLLPMSPVVPTSSDAAISVGICVSTLYPYWLKPGDTIGPFWSGNIAATETFDFRVTARIVQMRI